MRKENNTRDEFELIIPDSWSGINPTILKNGTVNTEPSDHDNFMDAWHNLKGSELHKVLLLCDNVFASISIREALGELSHIHLRVLKEDKVLTIEAQSFSPDSIICFFNSPSELCDKIPELLKLRKIFPAINCIIICDDVPKSLLGQGKVISGITILSNKSKLSVIRNNLSSIFEKMKSQPLSLKKLLTLRQLEIIKSYASGMSTRSIGESLNIDCKTVLAHKYLAFKRLSIKKRSQQAWVANAITILANISSDTINVNKLQNSA